MKICELASGKICKCLYIHSYVQSGGLNRLDGSWPVSPTKTLIDQSY